MHAGYAFNAFSSASLDHIVLFEFVYLILKLKKTHAVLRLQLSTELFFFLWGNPPLPAMCWEACVVACLHASVWSGEQTQSVVVLWRNPK